MNQMLGMEFTSIWMAFFYLVIFCLAATVLERVIGRLTAKVLHGAAAKAARLILLACSGALVLWGVDCLFESVSLQWWTNGLLSILMAVVMVLPENSAPAESEESAQED